MSTTPRSRSVRAPWLTLVVTVLAGIPLGLLWWLLAPGGLNLITRDPALAVGTNPMIWLPRDLTLAGLLLVAGCVLAVILADRRQPEPARVVLVGLVGALCGAVLAWQVGLLAGTLWGPAVDPSYNPSVWFSLRAWPVLLIWPAVTAIGVFVFEIAKPASSRAAVAGDESIAAAGKIAG